MENRPIWLFAFRKDGKTRILTSEYFIHEDRTKLVYKSILSTSFSNNGKTMQLFVNYNLKPVLLGFSEEKTIYLDSKLSKSISTNKIEIPPLEVVAIIKE